MPVKPSSILHLSALSLGLVLGGIRTAAAESATNAVAAGGSTATKQPAAPSKKAVTVKHVDPAAAASLLSANTNVVVLDVRTPSEFADGHIAGAKNVDFNDTKFSAALEKLDRDKTYLVHCAAGGRSTRSLKAFEQLGFKSVIHLDGGLKAWESAGKPVVK